MDQEAQHLQHFGLSTVQWWQDWGNWAFVARDHDVTMAHSKQLGRRCPTLSPTRVMPMAVGLVWQR